MKPYVIVLGNEKGGTGKSTIAMHVAVYLLNRGFKVGTIDVDARQGTFSQYFEHRRHSDLQLKMPEHIAILKSNSINAEQAKSEDINAFNAAMQKLSDCDFIVIDTPGNDTYLSQVAHSYADTLITPLNDSFIDLDVLVKVANNDMKILRPSIYEEKNEQNAEQNQSIG